MRRNVVIYTPERGWTCLFSIISSTSIFCLRGGIVAVEMKRPRCLVKQRYDALINSILVFLDPTILVLEVTACSGRRDQDTFPEAVG